MNLEMLEAFFFWCIPITVFNFAPWLAILVIR